MNTINPPSPGRTGRSLLWLLALGVALAAGLARPALARDGDARDAVNQMRQQLAEVAVTGADGESVASRLRRLEHVTAAHTDVDYTAKLMLGDAWAAADERQRRDFTTAFRAMLVSSYADQLTTRANQTTVLSPPRVDASGRIAEVRTHVSASGMPEMRVDYRLHRTADGWKVYDLSVGGIGIVATYAGMLRNRVRNVGMDGLIRELLARNPRPQDT